MNLLVGTCFHAGIESLLKGASVETAVYIAVSIEFWPLAKSKGLMLESAEDASYVYYEQAALIEALIRGYATFVLPQLLERFTVVEVEKEEIGRFEIPGFVLNFGARVDGLLLEKDSLDLFVLSLKTAKEWSKKDDEGARHDMQGLSETRVVEQRLGRWQKIWDSYDSFNKTTALSIEMSYGFNGIPQWFYVRASTGAPPTVSGVLMQYALKGRREESPKGSGRYTFANPLIRPWKKADDLGRGNSYAFRYEFKDEMGENHRLGKGWNRVNIWEDMGVKKWIEYLATNEVQGFPPMTALAGQFVLPIEYFRNLEDMEEWEEETIYQEQEIAEGLEKLKTVTNKEWMSTLRKYFRKQTRSCDWPTKCSFQNICFGPKAYLHDPISSGLYEIRVANHPTEVESNAKT